MEPISNTTRLVLLLRQRLLERSANAAGGKARGSSAAPAPRSSALDTSQALAGVDGIDERQLKRALIQDILADQFGTEMLNQAKFQQVVDNVTATLEDDAGASALLANVVSDLRAASR
jgi:hypothetical protein